MVEASPVKFYLAKYFFLMVAIVLWVSGCVLFIIYGLEFLNILAVSTLEFAGVALVFVFLAFSDRIKRVRIGDNKLVVMEDDDMNIRFGWEEVKSISQVPLLNLYKVRFRGRHTSFYFFSVGDLRQRVGHFIKQSTDVRNKLI